MGLRDPPPGALQPAELSCAGLGDGAQLGCAPCWVISYSLGEGLTCCKFGTAEELVVGRSNLGGTVSLAREAPSSDAGGWCTSRSLNIHILFEHQHCHQSRGEEPPLGKL